MSTIERERRFLLKREPNKVPDKILDIVQVYTRNHSRVRRITDTKTLEVYYEHTIKRKTGHGENDDPTRSATIGEFDAAMHPMNISRVLEKKRWVYEHFNGLKWEVDLFNGGQCIIAEIEVEDLYTPLIVPQFIDREVICEVTGDARFDSRNMCVEGKNVAAVVRIPDTRYQNYEKKPEVKETTYMSTLLENIRMLKIWAVDNQLYQIACYLRESEKEILNLEETLESKSKVKWEKFNLSPSHLPQPIDIDNVMKGCVLTSTEDLSDDVLFTFKFTLNGDEHKFNHTVGRMTMQTEIAKSYGGFGHPEIMQYCVDKFSQVLASQFIIKVKSFTL